MSAHTKLYAEVDWSDFEAFKARTFKTTGVRSKRQIEALVSELGYPTLIE